MTVMTPTATKRERVRLAKAEMLMFLAATAERSFCEFNEFDRLRDVYGLTESEMYAVCHTVGGRIETLAMQTGYEERWDS